MPRSAVKRNIVEYGISAKMNDPHPSFEFPLCRATVEQKVFGKDVPRRPGNWWSSSPNGKGMLPLKFEHGKCDFLDPLLKYPKVTNVVVTVKVGRPVDLSRLSKKFPNMGKDAKFPANICKIDRGTSLIFTTGALLTAGCKTYNAAKYLCHLTRMMIESVKQPVLLVGSKSGRKRLKLRTLRNGLAMFENFRVVNIVSNGRPVKSISLAKMEAANCRLNWNPSYFPGLEQVLTSEEVPFCRSDRVSITSFGTGKQVQMGARALLDTYASYHYIAEKASNFPDSHSSLERSAVKNKKTARPAKPHQLLVAQNPSEELAHADSDIDDMLDCFDVL